MATKLIYPLFTNLFTSKYIHNHLTLLFLFLKLFYTPFVYKSIKQIVLVPRTNIYIIQFNPKFPFKTKTTFYIPHVSVANLKIHEAFQDQYLNSLFPFIRITLLGHAPPCYYSHPQAPPWSHARSSGCHSSAMTEPTRWWSSSVSSPHSNSSWCCCSESIASCCWPSGCYCCYCCCYCSDCDSGWPLSTTVTVSLSP